MNCIVHTSLWYSEQKNCPTKGQISLVRQISVQVTKLNLWESSIARIDILSLAVPSNRHLVYAADFILTLRWDPFHGTVFLHTIRLAPHPCTTWLNLKYHVTWSSTTYRTPLVQLYPQQRCPGTHSESSLLWSRRVNFAIRWPLKWTSATLWSEGFTSMSAALPPGCMVALEQAHTWRSTPCPKKSHVWSSQ